MPQQQQLKGSFSASHAAVVGRYTYRPDTDEWWWSDAMFAIHGFAPGEVLPSTELVLRHIHSDDVPAAWESREQVVSRREPFSFLHRILAADGRARVVLAAGHLEDHDGAPVIVGHLVDITDLRHDAATEELTSKVSDFAEHRAVIEQAKGVLIQLYSVDAGTAWGLLQAFSQDSNRKVRDIAAVLVEAAGSNRTPARLQAGRPHDVLEHLYRDCP